MAAQKNTNVYLEAVEAAKNKGREPKEMGSPIGWHTETEIHVKAIGLLQAAEYFRIPLQTKDLHAGDIMIYPKRTSLCTAYD